MLLHISSRSLSPERAEAPGDALVRKNQSSKSATVTHEEGRFTKGFPAACDEQIGSLHNRCWMSSMLDIGSRKTETGTLMLHKGE